MIALIKMLRETSPSRLLGCQVQTWICLGFSALPWARGAGQCATATGQEADRWHWRQLRAAAGKSAVCRAGGFQLNS